MSIQIEEVHGKNGLMSFIKFPFELYKNNPCYVPPIIDFELSTLLPEKNPAFDSAEAKYFVAKKEGKIVGRIAGIILDAERDEKQLARFGWMDFIDDQRVSMALLEAVINWARSKGIKGIHGPLGFTDMDFEGMLISRFDVMASQATTYNHPYYPVHMDAFGFEKACDWKSIIANVPAEMPKRINRSASLISNRFKLYPKKFRSRKEILKYAQGVFKVINESFKQLYGYYELTPKQIDYYVEAYFGFIKKEFVTVIVNDKDEVVAAAITLPSLSKAFQKAKGSLYPFGFFHVLRAFQQKDLIDMLLIGVHPEYQKLGASQLIFAELLKSFIDKKVKTVGTAIMLEDNRGVMNLWNEFQDSIVCDDIVRRCYIKQI
ncbi:MAG: GNAT family N-acetyltransferase [Cyclobacteriaceae bacterium]